MRVEGKPHKDGPLPRTDVVARKKLLEKRGHQRRCDAAEKQGVCDAAMRGQRLRGTEKRSGKDI